jgi:hypothetical protein
LIVMTSSILGKRSSPFGLISCINW